MAKKIIVKQDFIRNILHCALTGVAGLLCLLFLFWDSKGWLGALLSADAFHPVLSILAKAILLFGFGFFGRGFITHIRRIAGGKDVLVVDGDGIADYSSAASLGFIPWEDVSSISMGEAFGNQYIEVAIKNEYKYLTELKGIKKLTVRENKRAGHELVCITLRFTREKPGLILSQMQEIFEGYKAGLSK